MDFFPLLQIVSIQFFFNISFATNSWYQEDAKKNSEKDLFW